MSKDLHEYIMNEAYQCFLDWAWRKDEIMEEYMDVMEKCFETGSPVPTFVNWVTIKYWGDENEENT